jgi:hypothetical protein
MSGPQDEARSFYFRLQPDLDKAADGFRARRFRLLLCDPRIKRPEEVVVPPNHNTKTLARRLRAPTLLFRDIWN